MANPSDPGFRMTTHSPEELERFAALFIPTWELPAEIATGPDLGFKPAAMDMATVTALTEPKPDPKPMAIKATMMAMSPPPPQAPEPVVAPVIVAPVTVAPVIVAPEPVVAPAAPLAPPAAFRPQPVASIDDDFEPAPKKKSGMMFAVIGGLVVVGAIGAFIATRGGDEPKAKSETTEKATEKKTMELPEPTVAPIEAKTTEPPAKTAEPTPPPKETAAAKPAAEPPPPPPKATAAPPPPKATAAPPPPAAPKATAAPAPKPTATPAKKPKIKDEF